MTFDPSAFVDQNVDGPLETQLKPIPPGEYLAMIGDFNFDEKTFRRVETKNGERTIFRCPLVINDEELKAKLGRETLIINHDIWLDTEDDGITLKTGGDNNVRLGQLRAAVGQNGSGAWNFGSLRNAGPVRIQTSLRRDPKTDIDYAEVKKIGTP